jgi:uncharacterized Zn finger protein
MSDQDQKAIPAVLSQMGDVHGISSFLTLTPVSPDCDITEVFSEIGISIDTLTVVRAVSSDTLLLEHESEIVSPQVVYEAVVTAAQVATSKGARLSGELFFTGYTPQEGGKITLSSDGLLELYPVQSQKVFSQSPEVARQLPHGESLDHSGSKQRDNHKNKSVFVTLHGQSLSYENEVPKSVKITVTDKTRELIRENVEAHREHHLGVAEIVLTDDDPIEIIPLNLNLESDIEKSGRPASIAELKKRATEWEPTSRDTSIEVSMNQRFLSVQIVQAVTDTSWEFYRGKVKIDDLLDHQHHIVIDDQSVYQYPTAENKRGKHRTAKGEIER